MIINFRFLQKFKFEHNDLILCQYFVTFYDNFERLR